MKSPNWYRFYEDGRIQRKNGGNWENINDAVKFRQLNDMWLTGNVDHPIKPFSKTGRIRIGKSQVFEAFIRAEVYNLVSRKVQAVSHRAITYKVDPDRDDDYSDSYLITQKDFTLVLPELE